MVDALIDFRRAHDAALLGEVDNAREWVRDDGALSRAWVAAVDSALWLANGQGRLTDLDTLGGFVSGSSETRQGAARACGAWARAAAIRFDDQGLARAVELLTSLVDPNDTEIELELRLLQSWQRLAAGPSTTLASEVRALEREAAGRSFALGVVQAAALQALTLLHMGELALGLEEARRAARMARTEAIVEGELLAGLTLARARRYTGRPHLGACILSAMRRFTPVAWRNWLDWELAMCGDERDSTDALARMQRATVHAAGRGDRILYEKARDELLAACRSSLTGLDALMLVAGLDARADERNLPEPMLRWRRGEEDAVPFGLAALSTSVMDEKSVGSAIAFVVAAPDAPARRVLRPGALLHSEGALLVEQQQRHQGRSDTLLSALLLAGESGLAEDELFSRIYGFRFRPTLHKDVLKLLLHRTRSRLGAAGKLVRGEGRVSLLPSESLVVVDPRSSSPVDERVLKLVATRGSVSAKQAAEELGLPLRTTQAALEALVAENACHKERSGRQVEYLVDDTTFEVPTRHRVT